MVCMILYLNSVLITEDDGYLVYTKGFLIRHETCLARISLAIFLTNNSKRNAYFKYQQIYCLHVY